MNSYRIKTGLYFIVLFFLPLAIFHAYYRYGFTPDYDWMVKLHAGVIVCMSVNFVCCAWVYLKAPNKLYLLPLVYGISMVLFYIFPSEYMIVISIIILASLPIVLIYIPGFIVYDKYLKRHDGNLTVTKRQ